jgi:hypothetical protein
MTPYNVFIVNVDAESNAWVTLIFSVNDIESAMDFIEKIILGDEEYYSRGDLIHKSMNRSNCYTYVGNTNIINDKSLNSNFGGFIIEKINFLESWTNGEKDDYLENPPASVWMRN